MATPPGESETTRAPEAQTAPETVETAKPEMTAIPKPETAPETMENPKPETETTERTRPETAARPPQRNPEPPGEQISLFPSEAEQIAMIRESESVDAPSDFPVSQEEMDLFLRVGSNTEHGRMKLLAEYAANNPEITEFVKRTFHHGYGLITSQGPVSAWAVEDGIRFARGNAARYAQNAQILPWDEAASRIARLLDEGRFVTNVEIVENPGFERREIAEAVLHLFGDLTEEAQNKGYLSRLREMQGGGFPDELERLAAALEKPEIRDPVTEEFRQFVTAWRKNHELLRFRFHKPDETLSRLDRLKTPRREFHSDMAELPETRPFITEDEINHAVLSVSTEGKIRVRDFWRTHTSSKERANFLRDMYGTGGYSSGVSNAFNSWMFYESKGMTLKKGACADVQLSWNAVASRVDALMAAGRYLSDEELERYQRKRQEREQSRAAQTPDTEKPDTEKPSDRREPIPETPESETVTPGEDVSATVQELTATENVTPEISNVAEVRTNAKPSPIADASSDTTPDNTETAAPETPAPKIDFLSPILHYIDLILPWENVEGFFRDHPSEQERIDYMRRRFAFRPHGHADVTMNGREGIRVEFEAVPDRLEIWTEDSAAPEFGTVLSWREVCRAVADELGLEPTREEIFQAYAAVKVDHPNDLVLYQTGDFFEIFGEDAERAAPLLGINLGEKPAFQGESAVAFCGVPANALDLYLPKLREQYDVTVCGVTGQKRERTIVSFLSFAHEAQQASRVPEPVRAGNAPTVSREPVRDATFREPTRDGNDSQTPQKPEQTLPPEPPRQSEQRPPREVTQEDADEALRRWNGNMDSKRAVVRHMNAHARERETAAWLSREFSGQETPSFRAELPDEGLTVEIPWPKVQRRIAQLIKQDKFFTAEELDNFENIDPVEIKEALAERAAAREETQSPQEETTAPEPAVITPNPEDVSVPGADRNGEKFDPFAPPYHVGDTVWLENAAFQISAIRTYDVELLDPTLRYPVHRAENRALFEIMLYQDPRNGSITEYLPANLKNTNGDLLNILTENGGLLYEQDRARIAGWIRAGESNAQIAQRLPGMLTGRSDTVTLLRGDRTDYRAAEKGLEIRAPDSADKLTFYWFDWPEIASILRAKFQQEREGFYRDPAIKEAVNLPGTLRYQVGDSVVVPYPDRYIIGTVGYITNLEVRIDTGGNSWESELVNRIRFEEVVRHDERNAHLFQPEEATRETETSEPDGTEADTPEIVSAGPTDAETPLTAPEPETGVPEAVSAPVAGTNAPAPEFSQAGNEDTPEDFCPYKVGDTVYLDDTAFLITEIRRHSVQLQDPALSYPVSRAESREYFERLLRRDIRNAFITDFLAASLDTASGDLIEALTGDGGLLESRDKKRVSGWFRAGESNPRVAQRLSDFYAGTAETMTLSGGERADYFASTASLQILITDGRATSLSFPWNGIAPLLRAMYQRERNGFQRDAPSAQPVYAPEAKPAPTPEIAPEKERAPQPDIVAEITEITPTNITELAESALTDIAEPAAQAETATETQAAPEPAKKNFRITDERLGEGGPKAKYRMNVEAIRTLKEIERDGRSASEAEQEILSRYVGWGGIPDAFDPDKEAWSAEYRELKELLTDNEYRSARASTLNAHYTSPVVIKAVYEALGNMGFKTGNILEPSCGIGNFFGLLPESMGGSKLYGVELDSVTGRIAGQLYPEARITVRGYEKTNFPRDFFDIAIGNVPFGNYQVSDPAYNKLGFTIHNYFFAKALDHVRPGGVVAFLTSRYTLDSQNSEVREYLAKRARLLGAIRLPNDAFKANAGTEVVSDIIFLQKSDAPIVEKPDWIQTGENSDGFAVNRYFLQNPDMVLGLPTSESTRYGQDYTVEPLAGVSLAELLHQAVANIRGEIKEAELPDLGEDEPVQDYIPADPNVRNFSYAIVNGEVYYRENSLMVRPDLSEAAKERVRGMVELRDCVHRLIALQMDGSEALSIYMEQQKLNKLYDAYTAKYGLINNRNNASAFSADSAYYLLCSLEILDNEGRLERKADMFTKRTIKPHAAVTRVDTASEALAVSIAEKAKVDIGYMSQLSGKSEEELTADLKGVIFLNPMSLYSNRQEKYLAADEYLSGNVRQKLQEAERTAVLHPEIDLTGNIEALRQAQPKDLDASEIDVRLGATWVDKRYIQQFMYELLKTPWDTRRDIRVNYSAFTSEWSITHKSHVSKWDVAARTAYGTSRINAYHILEDTLNLRDVRIYDTDKDPDTGKERRVLNQKETTLAQQKQQAIKDAFRDWVWKDPRRRQDLAQTYNRLFNAIRPREYNGQHITFSGINPEITLREHQLNAIAHVLYGGNTLLAHEVGAGKTFEMVAAAMESKRLGLCQKSLFAVPNHLTEQWAAEFLRLYPSANILVATKRDFETRNRKKFCARIATGDYDAIIIGHSQFEKIPVSYERRERLLQEQIMEIEEGIEELELSGAEEFSVKQMKRTKRSLEARLEKLQSTERKDDVVTFEQLGVDRLFVDEAHSYKNLFLYTKMYNVAGLSTSDAQKSSDMLLKCRYMDEITGSKGVIFATGTPVSNSMSELFTMQRYLQHNLLTEHGLAHFDNWVSVFGETVSSVELGPEGKYRVRNRLANFYNLTELMSMFREAADIKTADQLDLPAPEVEFHVEKALPTPEQKELVEELANRAARVHTGRVDPKVDNMLKITNDGRKLGLDQRLINPNFPDNPESKVNMCVSNIVRIWREGQADRLTQIVFCDLSTPKGKAAATRERTARRAGDRTAGGAEIHALGNLLGNVEPDAPFSVYEDIRDKLIARGVPANQIAFIHDADTEAKKKELFAKVRSGKVRVLMGSTFKMGAGTNVQDRLIAMHDLDCPWRPGDLEQRKGRIVRQGNMNPKVHIYRYVTEGTFDSYLWQTVEKKQRFISQIMTSKSPVRSCRDMDETALSYAEIKALCAGNPLIKEKMDLDIEVARLTILKKDHESQQFRLEDDVLTRFPEEIKKNEGFIAGFQADMATVEAHPHPENGFAGMTLRGDTLTDKDNAGAALLAACKEVTSLDPVEIGSYRGFSMLLAVQNFGHDYVLTLKGEMTHRVTLGKDAKGNFTRIDNALAGMPQRLEGVKTALENLKKQMEEAKAEIGKPFPQEALLREKSERLAEVNALLNIGGDAPERDAAKSERVSVLTKLKQPLPPPQRKQEPIKPKPRRPER